MNYKTPAHLRAKRRARYAKDKQKSFAQTKAWRKKNPYLCRVYEWRQRGYPMPTTPMPLQCDLCRAVGKVQLDHNHATNAFRGWLCHKCNKALGLLGDSAELLRRAAAYLDFGG